MDASTSRGAVKACCAQAANLVAQPQTRPDLLIRVCQVCGCRHFDATADVGRLGVVGTTMK